MAAGDLTTVADVEAAAGIVAGAATDTQLGKLITAASVFIRDQTGWPYGLGSQASSEIRDGSGSSELVLAKPATTVTSLAVGAAPILAQTADGQPGYFLAGQVLCLQGYRFTRGRKNVRVSYSGDAGAPADLAQACIEIVVAAYKRVPRGPEMQSEAMVAGGGTVSFRLKDMPEFAKAVITTATKWPPV